MNKIFSLIKTISIQIIFTFILLELLSFIGTKFNLFLVNDTPGIYRDGGRMYLKDIQIRTENMSWGAWRLPNAESRQSSNCYDVKFNTNEVGARDNSFIKNYHTDIVLLGDSFAEGLGVNYEKTAQFLLESKLNLNVLNFGIAGSFGPLQEYIIYEKLASKYLHQQVIVFVLPANDFADNERESWNTLQKKIRYRPYYSIEGDPVIPWYFPESIPTEKFGEYVNLNLFKNQKINNIISYIFSYLNINTVVSNIKLFLTDFTWSSNTLRSLSYLISKKDSTVGSSYLSATISQQNNMLAAYKKIVEIANGKPVNFIIIPYIKDILVLNENVKDMIISQIWYQGLQSLAYESGGVFIDLLDFLPDNSFSIFHSCDTHWNDEGNAWAAEIISKALKKNLLR
jgi:hypothetical protein